MSRTSVRRLLSSAVALLGLSVPGALAQRATPDPRPPDVDVALEVLRTAPAVPDAARAVLVAHAQRVVDEVVAAGFPGASAALALPDGSTIAVVAGVTEPGGGRPLATRDRMLVGSTGKTFVTAVAHRLVAEGRLDLDASLADVFDAPRTAPDGGAGRSARADAAPAWLDRLPCGRGVTVRQLLRHESGLPRYVFRDAFARTLAAEPDRVWRPEELLAFVEDAPPLFGPGDGWAYSDTNYVVVGLVLEHVTGRAFYELAREGFVEPLALVDTVPTNGRRVPGLVQGTILAGRALGGVGPRLLDEHGAATYNLQFEWCGGGWASTPTDLARWARALYGGAAIDAPYLDTLLDAVDAPGLGPGTRYGLGVMLRDTPLGELRYHDGFMPGHLTTLGFLPDHDVGVALQLNADDERVLGRPRRELLVELAEPLAR